MPRIIPLLLALGVAATACSGTGPATDVFGEELYRASCARCHGGNLQGGIGRELGPGSNAAVEVVDEQIAGVIRVGPGAMPAFGRLTPEQIDSLVAYLREKQAAE